MSGPIKTYPFNAEELEAIDIIVKDRMANKGKIVKALGSLGSIVSAIPEDEMEAGLRKLLTEKWSKTNDRTELLDEALQLRPARTQEEETQKKIRKLIDDNDIKTIQTRATGGEQIQGSIEAQRLPSPPQTQQTVRSA
jgi:hypothetical protein